MTRRDILTLCACSLVLGMILGWGARVVSTHDRYVRSLAGKHEAAESYFNTKLADTVRENERKIKHGN